MNQIKINTVNLRTANKLFAVFIMRELHYMFGVNQVLQKLLLLNSLRCKKQKN